jgi:hypothetical protein
MSSKDADQPLVNEVTIRHLHRAKFVLFVLHFLTFIGQLILVAAANNTFEFNATIISVSRIGPVDDSLTPGSVITTEASFSVEYLFAATNLFAALAFLVCIFYDDAELAYLSTGRMPYVWLFYWLSAVPLHLAVALVAGVADFYLLVMLTAVITAACFMCWIMAYIQIADVETAFVRTFYFLAIAFVTVVYTLVIISHVSIKVNSGGPSIHLLPVIVSSVFDLILLIVLFGEFVGWFWSNTTLVLIYCFTSIDVMLVTGLGLITFATDGITYP